jgi:hypothetical protein
MSEQPLMWPGNGVGVYRDSEGEKDTLFLFFLLRTDKVDRSLGRSVNQSVGQSCGGWSIGRVNRADYS